MGTASVGALDAVVVVGWVSFALVCCVCCCGTAIGMARGPSKLIRLSPAPYPKAAALERGDSKTEQRGMFGPIVVLIMVNGRLPRPVDPMTVRGRGPDVGILDA